MVVEGLDWLPDDGVALTKNDLERVFSDLRALIDGTDRMEPTGPMPSISRSPSPMPLSAKVEVRDDQA